MIFAYLIAIFAVANIVRMAIFLIGADIYDLKLHKQIKKSESAKKIRPALVNVLIPAHNEETVIIRSLDSVLKNDYKRFKIIVVDDGSTDGTYNKVRYYIRKHKLGNKVRLMTQKNAGKGHALNNAIKRHIKSGLVMVLDSDSTIAPDAIRLSEKYFRDNPEVVAASANIKIMPDKRFMGLVQEYEYIISNRMRKSFNVINSEYVIGGVGSMFRLPVIKKAGFYSNDTITEDLDLTFKIIQLGNVKHRIGYASNVHAYTEGVMTFRELIKQRFRWKYGRYQAYHKHRNLLFNSDKKLDQRLTKLMLPYTIVMDVLFFVEPFIMTLVILSAIYISGFMAFAYAYFTITIYVAIHLILDNTLKSKRKILLVALSPFLYFMLTVASVVEYTALIRSVARIPDISNAAKATGSWTHVKRSGRQVV